MNVHMYIHFQKRGRKLKNVIVTILKVRLQMTFRFLPVDEYSLKNFKNLYNFVIRQNNKTHFKLLIKPNLLLDQTKSGYFN